MPDKSNNPFQFWEELKRRRVIRVIPVYAAAAFVLLELVDIISEPLGLPDWTINFVLVLLGIGFIIAIILSWVYDITPKGIEKTKPSKEVTSSEKQPSSTGWKIATFVSVLIIIAFVVFYSITNIKQSSDISKLEKSIAVLPFKSLSNDPEKQYLADGAMDAVLLHLSKIEDLRVMSRTSVEQYRETEKTAIVIGQELHVAYLLEGSFQKYDDNVKLIVQLIRTSDDSHIWSSDYNRNWKDIFSVQSEVAQTIANELQAAITPMEKQLIERIPTSDLIAYDYYLLGRHSRSQRSLNELIKAKAFFEKAIEIDPEFVKPYIGLAHCYGNIAFSGKLKPKDAYLPAMDLALKVLEMDSMNAEAYTIMGVVNAFYFWDFTSAEKNLKRAIDLNPNYSETYKVYAEILSNSGQYSEAIKMEKLGLALDPFSPIINSSLGLNLNYVHQTDSAISHLTNMIMLNPDIGLYHWFLGVVYLNEGEYNRSIEELKKGLELSGDSYLFMALLGLAYSKVGNLNETKILLDTFVARSRNEYVPYSLKAVLLAELKQEEEALNYLFKAFEEKEEFLLLYRFVDTISFSNLRSDPRYIELMEKVWDEK